MKHVVFTFLIYCSFINLGFSQKNEYRTKFTQGNLLILEQNYSLALEYYLEAYKIDSSNANVNYKIGLCYLQMPTGKQRALPYLQKATQHVGHKYLPEDPMERKAPEEVFQLLGDAYRLDYKFKEAIVCYNRFKDRVGASNARLTKELDRQIEKNNNALEFVKDPMPVTITNLGDSINTIYPEYSPVISSDESTLFFTSRRPGSTGGEKTSDDEFYEDIYYSVKGKNGKWGKAKNIGSPINTNGNEANLSFSADGQLLFVYKDVNGGDIFYSTVDENKFGELFPIDAINSPSWETHASLSPDGNALYFVSDRKVGSYGGRDIWRCLKLPNGKWSLPSNLGPTINTAEDEDAPFMHTDGITLFFSSKGHKNMGGFDIFKATKEDDGSWSTPQNMLYPINTPDDDIFYMQAPDGRTGYFSSVRSQGMGAKDIYEVTFTDLFLEPLTVVSGYMTFNGLKDVPTSTQITATDVETNEVVQEVRPNSITGKYILILNSGTIGKSYTITYEAEKFEPLTVKITIPPGASYHEIEKELSLKFINLQSKTEGTIGILGTIKNEQGELVRQAVVVIKDNLTGMPINTYSLTADSGYFFTLNRGKNYNISYEASGYLFQSENVNVPKQPTYSTLTRNIVLEKIKVGSKMVLKNIFFDSNKSALRKESDPEIEKILKLLTDHKKMKIEVSGHTDNKGGAAANLKLSQLRSQAVVDELIKKGIDKTRLVAKGFGQTQSIAPNTLPNGKPNTEGMQLNRRVELRIIQAD